MAVKANISGAPGLGGRKMPISKAYFLIHSRMEMLYKHPSFLIAVTVAQLVEHRIVIPSVAGSSPVSHPNLFPNLVGNDW